jgi:hypothetical protein
MGEALPMFIPSFNPSLHIEARPDRLSAGGGAVVLREILEQSHIIDRLAKRLADPRAQDQIDYPLQELLRTVLVLYGQGWRDQDEADALRLNPAPRLAIAEAAGTAALGDGHHLLSQPTLPRLLGMLGQPANRRVLQEAVAEMTGRRVRATRRGAAIACAASPSTPTACRSKCMATSRRLPITVTTTSRCTIRSSPALRKPATCPMPAWAPAAPTRPRARSTSSSI